MVLKTFNQFKTKVDFENFKKLTGPKIKEIKKEQQLLACGSFRPLAELLLEWLEGFEKKLIEKGGQSDQYK